MVKLKKFDIQGKTLEEVEVEDTWLRTAVSKQLIKDYIVAIRANARQWSANTKTRSEVCHSNQKPHKQKGTGKARQGRLSSPQYKGGGVVFGPKPKFDQHVAINRKEKRQAIHYLFSEHMKDGSLVILQDTHLEAPKTKIVAHFREKVGLLGRTLFIGEGAYEQVEDVDAPVSICSEQHGNFIKSMKNLPKTKFKLVANVNGYDLMIASHVVISEKALQEYLQLQSQFVEQGS